MLPPAQAIKQTPLPSQVPHIEQFTLSYNNKPILIDTPQCTAPFGIDEAYGKFRFALSLNPSFIEPIVELEKQLCTLEGYTSYTTTDASLLRTELKHYRGKITTKLVCKGRDFYFSFFDKSKPLIATIQISTLWINHQKKEFGMKLTVAKVLEC